MTNATTPIQAAFEMQRETIKQTQQLFEQSLELQQNALEAFMHNGISAQRSAQKQATELVQQLANAQYDAIESAVDEDEIRAALDELRREVGHDTHAPPTRGDRTERRTPARGDEAPAEGAVRSSRT